MRVAKSQGFAIVDRKCNRLTAPPSNHAISSLRRSNSYTSNEKPGQQHSATYLPKARCRQTASSAIRAFRTNLKATVNETSSTLASMIPETRPNPQQYEVVYAIVTSGTRTGRHRCRSSAS